MVVEIVAVLCENVTVAREPFVLFGSIQGVPLIYYMFALLLQFI